MPLEALVDGAFFELSAREVKEMIVRQADWYFDFISPYAYLQFHQLHRLPKDVEVCFRPVLFAGLLNHWGQLGPAEILAKKRHTFLLCRWRAGKLGLPFKAPPRHPFNPLALLRLAIANGLDQATVGAIFDHIWADGQDGQDPASLTALASKIGVADIQSATSAQSVKDTLRTNTEDAVANGIYGVPTFQIDGQIFWGDDMLDMMLEWLDDPTFLNDPESRRIMSLPPAAERKRGV
ncbi:MAG: DsbA family protein [Alphaproteobacteria bacterium]